MPSLWGTDPDQQDYMSGITQGTLDDSYLLATAAALAQVPARIEKIFDSQTTYNINGIFQIDLHVRGEPVSIIIDDNIPMNPDDLKKPVNAQGGFKNSWWGPLLEKAYAKMNVVYGNIDTSFGIRSFRDLTGMPTYFLDIVDSDDDVDKKRKFITDFKADIEKNVIKSYPMITACFIPGLAEGENTKYGLRTMNAYTLIDTVDVKDGETDVTLIKLRNTFGQDEYTGPWQRSDTEKWTTDNKELAQLDQATNGVFFVPMDIYIECFYIVYVNMYDTKWLTSKNVIYTQGMTKEEKTQFNLVSTEDQNAFITFDWESPHLYPTTCDAGAPDLEIVIANAEGG